MLTDNKAKRKYKQPMGGLPLMEVNEGCAQEWESAVSLKQLRQHFGAEEETKDAEKIPA